MRIDQPQRRQPTNGPVVLSQKFLDLEGNRRGPMRDRVRQTPYQVSDTNVARKAAERRDERIACCIAFFDTLLKSKSVLIGK
jgi:hypothetical protein